MKSKISIQKNPEKGNDLIDFYKGFIVGASEDACIYHRKKRHAYLFEVEQKNKEWLEVIQQRLKRVYKKESKIYKRGDYYRLVCYSKDIYKEIRKTKDNLQAITKKSDNYKKGFLQGVYDAEGNVHKNRFSIRIASKNTKLIMLVKKLLQERDISCGSAYVDKRTQVISLPIYGKENLIKFNSRVGLNHPNKSERLKNLLRGP